MARKSTAEPPTDGDVLLHRLASMPLPASLKKVAAEFKNAQTALNLASDAARVARGDRDAALAAVGVADDALDAAVNVLGEKIALAQMGTRANPFAKFGALAPSAVTALPYADEVKEVLALLAKVKKAKPAPDVAKAVAACEKQARGVSAALSGLNKPQVVYAKALAARDALLPSWAKALSRLKKTAAAAWQGDEAMYAAMFAPPGRVQLPVTPRGNKDDLKKANGASEAPPAMAPKITT
jgi:hypothetical protein